MNSMRPLRNILFLPLSSAMVNQVRSKNYLFFALFRLIVLGRETLICPSCPKMLQFTAIVGESSNGRTADSGSACWGSNPYSPVYLIHR